MTSNRVPALDGLRVLAILAIIVYHANATWLPGGYFGVTVFFVLTGYLATLSLERALASSDGLSYPRYVLGRIKRMLPSMLVLVGGVTILCAVFSQPLLPKVQTDAIPALLFFENIYYIVRNVSYFAAAGLPSPLTHLWFVGVTMQFYLVWPLVMLLLSRVVRKRRTVAAIVFALAAASAVLMAVLYDPMGDTNRIYYGPDTRAGELLVGASLAILTRGRGWGGAASATHRKKATVPSWAYDLAGLAALAGLAVMTVTLNGYSEFAYRGGIFLAALLTAVVIGAVARPSGSVLGKVLGCAPLAELGKRGFALYLWHYPLLLIMNPATRTTELPWWGWVLEFVVIAVAAELSYRLFESRRASQSPRGKIGVAQALEGVALIAVVAITLIPVAPQQTGAPTEGQNAQSEVAAFDPETEDYDVSGTYLADTAFASAVDTINGLNFEVDAETGATDANVLLIGDSVSLGAADQFARVFPNGWIDSEVGRQLWTGLEVYNQCVADGHGSNVVVFALGNNGVAREGQVRELIDACGPDATVYLVTTRVPMALQDINNQLFRDVAAEYDNVEIIDWYAQSEGHDEYFWDDGTHLRPEGAEAYVMMLRKAITGR